MKIRRSNLLPLIPLVIGIIVMIFGIISRASGDTTGSEVVVIGSILLITGIIAFSSQRARSKVR